MLFISFALFLRNNTNYTKKLSFPSIFWRCFVAWEAKETLTFVLPNNDVECLKSTCIVLVDIHSEQVLHFFLSEKDYPPVARAGNDVVIVLPVDHVTLYGNGSTDDKVKHWETICCRCIFYVSI